ncbi:hypothetical protein PInf_006054 [Phytophthora infestans]|nr:hypothetical protein PInf_006054 [Phytophthora infestans]
MVAVTLHATGIAQSTAQAKAIIENGAEASFPAYAREQRVLRRVDDDKSDIEEERGRSIMEKLKSVVKKVNPKKGVDKIKEKVQETDWQKLLKVQALKAKRLGYD